MNTNVVSGKNIQRNWHIIDAKGKVLGRLAVEAALKLTGKNKTNYVPYLDLGDYVVVTNASLVKVTGKKAEQKTYYRHSGYPGGLKSETFNQLIIRRPEEVVRHAIKGMLPKNRLADKIITKLHIYAGDRHPYEKHFMKKEEVAASE